ncbi:LysR family transcriptional regulator [Streptomyces sp. ICC1]|uniref:LysR family transcriptional regulator n=1 Tax=Streptomyces sp. ICC1 TaxID=2099583 RepID=UPI0019550624|nr:LysR family transcriptional regulator [Streptomyces sp. ICC1]
MGPADPRSIGPYRLEGRLGMRLFGRAGRRLVPNPAGRRMLVAARHVLGELESATRDLRDIRDGRDRAPLRPSTRPRTPPR